MNTYFQCAVCATLKYMEPGRKEKYIHFSKDKFLNLNFFYLEILRFLLPAADSPAGGECFPSSL
jgi:hypothetical protein